MNCPREALAIFDIDTLLDDVVTLPSLPGTVAQLLGLVEDPNASVGDVADVVSSDPAISLKLLRLVNSAYYGLREEVRTVEHAVAMLGMKVVKNLVLTASVFDTLKDSTEQYLRHCVACGMAMRILAEGNTKLKPLLSGDEAFIYGLLHDIGKMLFEQFLPREYALIEQVVIAEKISWHQAEEKVIGIDHALLGARLAEKWRLPRSMVAAIEAHHYLARCPDPAMQVYPAATAIADYLCTASGLGAWPGRALQTPPEAWALCGLDSEGVVPIASRFFMSTVAIAELMEMALADA
ncbi:MAG: HDOD domain-containing protein [Candidatus Hydrogenedentes bacterium]|nr:HDOD domain-containing protein [Candidatus Hydrogenedentota bacterium]